jgi:hypothetical protein
MAVFPEDEDKLYREMDVSQDGLPLVGPTNLTLGVRTRGRLHDIQVGEDGMVQPRPAAEPRGGMSVAPRTPMNLSELHRPLQLGGLGSYPVWRISKQDLGGHLIYQETSATHGRIAPAERMRLEEYVEALEATRDRWTRVVG